MEAVQRSGLWVPVIEASRFEICGEFEGLPNLDVEKVASCAALSHSFATAIDVGAYIGVISSYLARRFTKVVSFEAVPETFRLLERNVGALPNVEVKNVAAGNTAEEVFFTHYPSHGQLSHVAGNDDHPAAVKIGPIPVQTIDSFGFADVSFIKIDVEGHELPVLEGARETILRCRPVIMIEQGGNEAKYFGRPRDEASTFLEGMGMRPHPEAPRMSKDRLFCF